MSKDEPSKAQLLLNQAKTYESLTWLGLLFVPLSIVFFIMCSSRIDQAKLYKMTKEETTQAKNIKSSSRNIMVTILILWTLGIAIWIFLWQNQTEQLTRTLNKYRY